MNLVLVLFILLICIFIALQDFKYRAVAWYLFPLLAFFVLTFGYVEGIALKKLILFFEVNLIVVFFQLFFLTIYFSIKNKKMFMPINEIIGLGDILFLIILCFAFSPINFILFVIIALFLTLLIILIIRKGKFDNQYKIPMAGYLSVFYSIVLIVFYYLLGINLYKDHFTEIILNTI